MDSQGIHKASENLKRHLDLINPSEAEWIYCGSKGEVKFDVVKTHLDDFFEELFCYVAITRKESFKTNKKSLFDNIKDHIGVINFFVWSEDFRKVIEFNDIGVFRKVTRI
jgi:hypothetical protein